MGSTLGFLPTRGEREIQADQRVTKWEELAARSEPGVQDMHSVEGRAIAAQNYFKDVQGFIEETSTDRQCLPSTSFK